MGTLRAIERDLEPLSWKGMDHPMTTTTDQSTFTAIFERDARGVWLAELHEIPQVHSYGKSLAKAREYLLDAARLWFDDGRTITLVDDVRLPDGVAASLRHALDERRTADQALTSAAAATWSAVRRLADADLTIRDSADLLGLSPQRVHQLLRSTPSAQRKRAQPIKLQAPLPGSADAPGASA